ncbi:MAG: Glutaredoxin [bacterium]|nr:Glutaredoxin [bacterium]
MPILVYFILLWDKLTGRRPLTRSADEQGRVDSETTGLALYHFQMCPYCRKARRDIRLLGLHIEERDIKKDAARRAELVAGGGKVQVPCLRIREPDGTERWLYESRDISRYLRERFGAGSAQSSSA